MPNFKFLRCDVVTDLSALFPINHGLSKSAWLVQAFLLLTKIQGGEMLCRSAHKQR